MDVKSDFIHGHLNEEIYMNHPKWYTSDPSLVCKLQKIIIWVEIGPKILVCQNGCLSTFTELPKMQI